MRKQLVKIIVGDDIGYIIVECGTDIEFRIEEEALDIASGWGEYDIEEDVNDTYDYIIYDIKDEYCLLDTETLEYMNTYCDIIKNKVITKEGLKL